MLNYSPSNCFMFRNSAADEVLILSLFQGSCLIVSEREVIKGVESWSFENKHLLCAH